MRPLRRHNGLMNLFACRLLAPLGACAVLALGAGPAAGAFPGSNGLIGFTSDRHGSDNLFATGFGSQAPWTRLTSTTPGSDAQLAWSADGSRIAFRSNRDGNFEVYVANADGSGQTRLTTTPTPPSDARPFSSMPSWSPSGDQIVFRSNRAGEADIWVMDADGARQRKLRALDGDERYPGFSPDGKQIVFQSDAEGNRNLYLMNADGTGRVKRLTHDDAFNSAPAWSPDGESIVFERAPSESSADRNALEIMLLPLDGEPLRQLTSNDFLDRGPAFSPDGTKIAFTTERDGNSEIYVMAAGGETPAAPAINVTNAPGTREQSSDWQPQPR